MAIAQFVGWFLGYLFAGYALVGAAGVFYLKSAAPLIKSGVLTLPIFGVVLVGQFEQAEPRELLAIASGGLCVFALYFWRLVKIRAAESNE